MFQYDEVKMTHIETLKIIKNKFKKKKKKKEKQLFGAASFLDDETHLSLSEHRKNSS